MKALFGCFTCFAFGLVFGLFLLFFNFLFDGLGFSRVSHYWEDYHGSMSWSAYRITLRPQGQAPPPDLTFPTLRYGFDLTNHVQLKAQLLQSEIPLADTGPLFYDTTRFARFSPDSVYYAWVGLRGNAFSFAMGAQPGFVILRGYQAAAAASATVPAYPVQTDWRTKWQRYAWARLSLNAVFFIAVFSIASMENERTLVWSLWALFSVLLFAAVAGYVDWYDYTTGDDWPIVKPILLLLLLVFYVMALFNPAPAAEATESPAGA